MTETDLRETLAVVVSRLDGLAEDVAEMRRELREDRREYVTNSVWTQRNHLVDNKHASMGREISELRTEVRTKHAELKSELSSRRISWPVIAALAVSFASLAWAILGPAIRAAG